MKWMNKWGKIASNWGGLWDIIEPSWTYSSALSSLSLVINDFRFDVSSPQTYNKTGSFIQTAKKRRRKKRLFVKERQGVYVALLPSSRKAGGSRRGSQPGSTLEGPHKSWFELGANQKRRDTSREERRGGGGAVSLLKCYVWLSLPIRWQLNFNINMIILK